MTEKPEEQKTLNSQFIFLNQKKRIQTTKLKLFMLQIIIQNKTKQKSITSTTCFHGVIFNRFKLGIRIQIFGVLHHFIDRYKISDQSKWRS